MDKGSPVSGTELYDDSENLHFGRRIDTVLTGPRAEAREQLDVLLSKGDHVPSSAVYKYLEPHGA